MKTTINNIIKIMQGMKLEALESSKDSLKELKENFKKDYLKTWDYNFNTDKVIKLVEVYDLATTFKKVANASFIEKAKDFQDFSDSDKADIEIFYSTIIKIASKQVNESPKLLDNYFNEILISILKNDSENTKSLLLKLLDVEFNDNDIIRLKDVIIKRNMTTFNKRDLQIFIYELCKAKLDYMGLYKVKKASVELANLTKEVGFISEDTAKCKDTMSVITVLEKAGIKYDSKDFNFKEEKKRAKKAIDNNKVAIIPSCLEVKDEN